MRCPFEHDGQTETLSIQQILAKLYDADRDVRAGGRRGADEGAEGQRPAADVHLQHAGARPPVRLRRCASSPTRWRRATWPTRSRAEVVEALMTAAERHHGTVQRYYRLKGRLLGLDQLVRLRPLRPAVRRPAGVRLADGPADRRGELRARSARRPAAIIREFFEKRWIDAELRPGKRGGALQQQRRAERPPVHPDELHRQAPRRDDAGPRAGPRRCTSTCRAASATSSATRR